MAEKICINAKVQRPGVCNAMETLLVHEKIAGRFLPPMAEAFRKEGVELRGCDRTRAHRSRLRTGGRGRLVCRVPGPDPCGRVVASMEEAIEHITRYGSQHTEAIVTENFERAHRFLQEVQSSLVLVNASTRFNDGFQLGLGAEIGISTSRLHAFGPMGRRGAHDDQVLIPSKDGQIFDPPSVPFSLTEKGYKMDFIASPAP